MRNQISNIQKTVRQFPSLSLRELGHTVCEHLGWYTPKDDYRIQSCLHMLQKLKELGILFAHFTLITLTQLFSNHSKGNINRSQTNDRKQAMQTNFKNNLITVARNIEGLFLQQKAILSKTLTHIVGCITHCQQRLRPNRSYERRSRKPMGKWMPSRDVALSKAVASG